MKVTKKIEGKIKFYTIRIFIGAFSEPRPLETSSAPVECAQRSRQSREASRKAQCKLGKIEGKNDKVLKCKFYFVSSFKNVLFEVLEIVHEMFQHDQIYEIRHIRKYPNDELQVFKFIRNREKTWLILIVLIGIKILTYQEPFP